MSSITIKALLPSPRYTCHDVTYSVLRNIRNLLTNCIFRAVNVFYGGIWKLKFLLTPSLTLLTALKMQFIRRLRMLLRHVMASVPGRWQHCLDCHGGHLQDVLLNTWGFLWIQDTDSLDRVQLYLLLCTINVLSQDTDLLDRVQLCSLLCTINVLSYFQHG